MVTLNGLRRDWTTMRQMLDWEVARIESESRIHLVGEYPRQATAAWLRKLRAWRNDLDELIASFPATS